VDVTSTSVLRPVHGEVGEVYAALQRWWEAPDGPIVVRTSGSTGNPRDVLLSRGALLASATAAQSRLGGPGQWLLQLPHTSIGGLQVLVRSLLSGTQPVVADRYPSLGEALAALVGSRRFTSLVPTQLHRLAVAGELAPLARFDAVLVGGAGLACDLRRRCEAAGVRIVATYGLTETCGGCVYDGRPLDGVSVRIGVEGRIEIAGPVLFDGYAGDPEQTARVLRDGWLVTSDLGELEADGRLHVLGRADDVVVSGGVNVPLPAVSAVLRDLPGVADAAAVGVPDVEWGTRVVACLALPPDTPASTLATIRDFCSRTLPREWAPRDVVVVDALPLLPGGKLDRAALRWMAAGR
jgi:O-succinylbenzoic acid--CoA ligase